MRTTAIATISISLLIFLTQMSIASPITSLSEQTTDGSRDPNRAKNNVDVSSNTLAIFNTVSGATIQLIRKTQTARNIEIVTVPPHGGKPTQIEQNINVPLIPFTALFDPPESYLPTAGPSVANEDFKRLRITAKVAQIAGSADNRQYAVFRIVRDSQQRVFIVLAPLINGQPWLGYQCNGETGELICKIPFRLSDEVSILRDCCETLPLTRVSKDSSSPIDSKLKQKEINFELAQAAEIYASICLNEPCFYLDALRDAESGRIHYRLQSMHNFHLQAVFVSNHDHKKLESWYWTASGSAPRWFNPKNHPNFADSTSRLFIFPSHEP